MHEDYSSRARQDFWAAGSPSGALPASPDCRPLSTLVAVDTAPCVLDDPRVDCRTGTITDDDFTRSIVDSDVDVVYHLAAVVSGQAEAEFDLGMRVNVDATRALLEACRRLEEAAALHLHEHGRRLRRPSAARLSRTPRR